MLPVREMVVANRTGRTENFAALSYSVPVVRPGAGTLDDTNFDTALSNGARCSFCASLYVLTESVKVR